jgi:hypothetical protein
MAGLLLVGELTAAFDGRNASPPDFISPDLQATSNVLQQIVDRLHHIVLRPRMAFEGEADLES